MGFPLYVQNMLEALQRLQGTAPSHYIIVVTQLLILANFRRRVYSTLHFFSLQRSQALEIRFRLSEPS